LTKYNPGIINTAERECTQGSIERVVAQRVSTVEVNKGNIEGVANDLRLGNFPSGSRRFHCDDTPNCGRQEAHIRARSKAQFDDVAF
jgi:hypothetical protein